MCELLRMKIEIAVALRKYFAESESPKGQANSAYCSIATEGTAQIIKRKKGRASLILVYSSLRVG